MVLFLCGTTMAFRLPEIFLGVLLISLLCNTLKIEGTYVKQNLVYSKTRVVAEMVAKQHC